MSTAAGARDMTESVPVIHTPAMNTPRAACATFNQFTLLVMLEMPTASRQYAVP